MFFFTPTNVQQRLKSVTQAGNCFHLNNAVALVCLNFHYVPGNDTVKTKMFAFIALKTSHESILLYLVCPLFRSGCKSFCEFLCFARLPVKLLAFGV